MEKKSAFRRVVKKILKYKWYYMLLIPLITWYIVLCYTPMYGLILAFKSYKFNLGITGSPFIGFDNFVAMMKDAQFRRAFANTLIISLGKLCIHFPLPIILALIMNELSMYSNKLSKFFQSMFTFPHLISWVVLAGIITNIFSAQGVVNQVISVFGKSGFAPLTTPEYFRPLIYLTHVWKEIGWDSIIYLAALTGINPEYNEAAELDGANRFQRIWHISLTGIRGTICILLILQVGNAMGIGSSFDQIFNLYSAPVYGVGDTIDTYIYRTTFTVGANFGYMTAIGMFKSIINLILIVTANTIVKKTGEEGLY